MGAVVVNGLGTIGRRVVHTLLQDPNVDKILGIKYSPPDHVYGPDSEERRRFNFIKDSVALYISKENQEHFDETPIRYEGFIEDALEQADLVIDAGKKKKGKENKDAFYDELSVPVIYQGGEPASIAPFTHSARLNFETVRDAVLEAEDHAYLHIRQGSCNVTGAGRMLAPMVETYADALQSVELDILRRQKDPNDGSAMEHNVAFTHQSHHETDIQQVLGDIAPDIPDVAVQHVMKIPVEDYHTHNARLRFSQPPSATDVLDLYEQEWGVALLDNITDLASIRDVATCIPGAYDSDTNLIHMHVPAVAVRGDTVHLQYSTDQMGIVAPDIAMLTHGIFNPDKNYQEVLEDVTEQLQLNARTEQLEQAFR